MTTDQFAQLRQQLWDVRHHQALIYQEQEAIERRFEVLLAAERQPWNEQQQALNAQFDALYRQIPRDAAPWCVGDMAVNQAGTAYYEVLSVLPVVQEVDPSAPHPDSEPPGGASEGFLSFEYTWYEVLQTEKLRHREAYVDDNLLSLVPVTKIATIPRLRRRARDRVIQRLKVSLASPDNGI